MADIKTKPLALTIRRFQEGNLKTSSKKQRNFETNSTQQDPNPRYQHSQHSKTQPQNYQKKTAKLYDQQERIGPKHYPTAFEDFKKPTLKLQAINSETLGPIADNRAQTLAITICSILEANLKTTSKKQRNFHTNRIEQDPNPSNHHSQILRS